MRAKFFLCCSLLLQSISPYVLQAEGTETLGTPALSLASGRHILVAGSGLNTQPGEISFTLPAGATVKQVLLYWQEWFGTCADGCIPVGDSTIVLSPDGNEIDGTLIGGGNDLGYIAIRPVTYRADITARNLVTAGVNTFSVSGISLVGGRRADGAGMLVVYDLPGDTPGVFLARDGSDTAYGDLSGELGETVPQTFTFAPSSLPRTANLVVFVASVDGGMGNCLRVTVGDDAPFNFCQAFANIDGQRWDSLSLPVLIPAGVEKVTVQVLSGQISQGLCSKLGGTPNPENDEYLCPNIPSALVWLLAGLRVPNLPPSCDLGGHYAASCSGAETAITINSSVSDPEGALRNYIWQTDCVGAQLSSIIGSPSARLALSLPGTGVVQQCKVTLTVDDGETSSTCTADVSINPCTYDCLGQLYGNAKLDLCGVCNGNNSCLDCTGSPFGLSKIDLCGVCGGDNSTCSDCLGVTFGSAKIDACGVCAGDNSSCVDCLGVPNGKAVKDACGVCNGNNQCKREDECIKSEVVSEVSTLQQRLLTQKTYLRQLIRTLDKGCGRIDKKAKQLAKKLQDAQITKWQSSINIIAGIPTLRKACSTSCEAVTNTNSLTIVRGIINEWFTNSLTAIRAENTCNRPKGKCEDSIKECKKRLRARLRERLAARSDAKRLYQEAKTVLDSLPQSSYRCV